MINTILLIIHVIVTIGLIVVVLLQKDNAAGGLGGSFGGGASQTVFGSSGAETFFSKLTTFMAIIFVFTSISLAYISSHKQVTKPTSEMKTNSTAPKVPVVPNTK